MDDLFIQAIMIQSLRKKHFRLWTILPLLLVSGIICTAYLLPQEVIENSNVLKQDSSEGSLVYYHEYSEYILAIRKNNGTSNLQLEWTTKNPLKIPSANLYIAASNNTEDKSHWILLGSIGKKGTERFIIPFIPEKRLMIELYDSIHNNRIRQFEIQL
ncbi:MAG TPA: hypothetical protein PKK99_09710 [Bacteroidia bacterium]|nr:hypothetical protein [Bacteroidia bacterium]